MWNELLQGGVGVAGIGVAIKVLWPLFKSRLDADGARANTDTILHNLYQETLKEMRQLSVELSQARFEISRLKGEVEQLTHDLNEARKTLSEYQESKQGA